MIQIIVLILIGCLCTLTFNYLAYRQKKKRAAQDRKHKSDIAWAERQAKRRNYPL